MPDDDRFRTHLPALAASAVMTIALAAATSWFGTGGTLAGMAGGSVLSGAGAWWTERALRKSAAITAAKARARKTRGRDLTGAEETRIIEQVHAARARRPGTTWWKRIGGLAAASLITAALALGVVEHAAGKPLSDVVRGRPGYGTTLGKWRWTGPAPLGSPAPASSSPAATVTGSAPAPNPDPDPSPDATPDPAPDPAGTTAAGSATDASGSPIAPQPDQSPP